MPTILYRSSVMEADELAAARRHFPCTPRIVGLEGELVLARYRALPFYEEYAADLAAQGARPINSLAEHSVVASFDWYHLMPDLTPRTWFATHLVPKEGGPFIVKGVTSSKKEQWNTMMLAPDFPAVMRIAMALQQDGWIGHQPLVVREYVPLRTLEVGINDLPFANEHRCFALRGQILSTGYYWSGASDEAKSGATFPPEALALAQEAARRLADHVPFTAIDVAETADGRWVVIEVNDGQMSGLSDTDPEVLYAALAQALDAEGK